MKKHYARSFALSDKGTSAILALAMLIPLVFVALGGVVFAVFARGIGPMLLHDWRKRDAPQRPG